MATKTLVIKQVIRTTSDGNEEALNFQPGVNVIMGRPNTGKSVWLNMIDFLFGDRGKPEDAFGAELVDKYASIKAIVNIGVEEITIERNWQKRGLKTKVLVNGESLSVEDFSDYLLEKLSIPNLHHPKGSPYAGTWNKLSWRTLFRHIYRQQRFWNDFADQQTESEQHASLLLFLGIAEYIYSEKYGELVEKRKTVYRLEGAKEEFQKILDRISIGLLDEQELGVGITEQSIDFAIRRLQAEIQAKQHDRETSLIALLNEVTRLDSNNHQPEIEKLSEVWANLQTEREENLLYVAKTEKRIVDLTRYQDSISNELSKINRTDKAAKLFANLKITHCPACDQSVEQEDKEGQDHCFLCHQSINSASSDSEMGAKRIQTEKSHLTAELDEVKEMLENLLTERTVVLNKQKQIDEDFQRADNQLKTVRRATASIVSPEITIGDMEIGRLQERIRQLERIRSTLEIRTQLAEEINILQKALAVLEEDVNHLMSHIDYSTANDVLSDGMTTYLNALNGKGRKLWDNQRVMWRVKERNFDVKIGNSKWSSRLGGTLRLYFLLSYHYALLSFTQKQGYHYPGLAILDLPPKLDDGTVLKDEENFILEPFVELLKTPGMLTCQVIAAGAAFENLENAHRIKLDHVWL